MKQSQKIDPNNLKESTAGGSHNGHLMWNGTVEFELERVVIPGIPVHTQEYPKLKVGKINAFILLAISCERNSANILSVPIGKCGPCCSQEPIGRIATYPSLIYFLISSALHLEAFIINHLSIPFSF